VRVVKLSNSIADRRPKGLFVGLAAIDISYTVEEIPLRNQKISVTSQIISAGGPATNAAATFAFLGGSPALVTAVGQHPLASVIRDDLKRSSIRLHDMASGRRVPPPVSSILVHRATGDRTVVSANAAAFSPLRLKFDPRWLSGASVVEVDGQYMSLCIEAARAARARRTLVVLDSGSWKPGMAKLLPLVDAAICSGDFRPPGCRTESDVLGFLAARRIPRIAITRGASSIRFLDRGKPGEITIRKARAVDTLGAGDIFHGAYCYYACQPEISFRDALLPASRVATFSCRYAGTRSWMDRFSPAD
jgi:sugar/nucleoside kinase (ribokinase family)